MDAFGHTRRFHFMGVGGAGMSSLALFLLKKNFVVSGCDIQYSETIKKLEEEGLIFLGSHSKEHVKRADVLVYSSAVPENHPEIEEAKQKGKITIKRIELLSEILNVKKSIAVIGSHGKTTTTSLIAHAMKKLGIPSIAIIGGILKNGDISEKVQKKEEEFAVAEVDESDKDFLKISPFFAVITNIDEEHLDKWGNLDNLKKAILNFANSVPIWGGVVLNIDDAGVRSIFPKIKRKVISCSVEGGVISKADIVAESISFSDGGVSFDLGIKKSLLGDDMENENQDNKNSYLFIRKVKLGISGRHNVSNSLLAFGVLIALREFIGEFDLSCFASIFSDFAGVKRRMELRGVKNGIYVIDDYAHHPSEIEATLQTIKLTYRGGKIVLVFEPHRFSRVAYLRRRFHESLKNADRVILTDIYPASEKNVWGVSPHDIIGDAKNIEYVKFSHVIDKLREILPNLKKGDLIVFMGAGNIKKLADEFLNL